MSNDLLNRYQRNTTPAQIDRQPQADRVEDEGQERTPQQEASAGGIGSSSLLVALLGLGALLLLLLFSWVFYYFLAPFFLSAAPVSK